MTTLTQRVSEQIRNQHRLSEIRDAQVEMDTLEQDAKAALDVVLKKHGLRVADFTLTLSLGKMPSLGNGPTPNGYLSASLVVE